MPWPSASRGERPAHKSNPCRTNMVSKTTTSPVTAGCCKPLTTMVNRKFSSGSIVRKGAIASNFPTVNLAIHTLFHPCLIIVIRSLKYPLPIVILVTLRSSNSVIPPIQGLPMRVCLPMGKWCQRLAQGISSIIQNSSLRALSALLSGINTLRITLCNLLLTSFLSAFLPAQSPRG